MVQQTKWVERSFNFDFPAGMFSVIVERLNGTPARMEEKIKNIPYMILELPYNNGWSIQEHAGHLIDLEALHSKRLEEFEAGATTLSPAEMSNQKTYEANYNNRSISDIMKEFRRVRKEFVQRIATYDEAMATRTAVHPRLQKPMRLVDMLYFVAEHDDHHLTIISRAHQELG